MTREQQRRLRELNQRIPVELKALGKEYGLLFAYNTLYRFEGDFVYFAIVRMMAEDCGEFSISFFIKPWALNETYWKIQHMDMDEMLSQPKTLHFNGAFTINNIKYEARSMPCRENDLTGSLDNVLRELDQKIAEHRAILKNADVLLQDPPGYKISSLCKAVVCIRRGEYDRALAYLTESADVSAGDSMIHRDSDGKTAADYAIECCKAKLI